MTTGGVKWEGVEQERTFIDNVQIHWGGIGILLLGFAVLLAAAIVMLRRRRKRASRSDDGES